MRISINIKSGVVNIESDTALMVKQDARDRQDTAIESVMGAILASIGEEGDTVDATEEAAPTATNDAPTATNDVPVGTTSSQTVRTVDADEAMGALKAMINEKPQWNSRSAAAVAKFFGADVDADSVRGALDTAVYNDDLSARTRRNGETVYSVN